MIIAAIAWSLAAANFDFFCLYAFFGCKKHQIQMKNTKISSKLGSGG
jgi:hypothetical protein